MNRTVLAIGSGRSIWKNRPCSKLRSILIGSILTLVSICSASQGISERDLLARIAEGDQDLARKYEVLQKICAQTIASSGLSGNAQAEFTQRWARMWLAGNPDLALSGYTTSMFDSKGVADTARRYALLNNEQQSLARQLIGKGSFQDIIAVSRIYANQRVGAEPFWLSIPRKDALSVASLVRRHQLNIPLFEESFRHAQNTFGYDDKQAFILARLVGSYGFDGGKYQSVSRYGYKGASDDYPPSNGYRFFRNMKTAYAIAVGKRSEGGKGRDQANARALALRVAIAAEHAGIELEKDEAKFALKKTHALQKSEKEINDKDLVKKVGAALLNERDRLDALDDRNDEVTCEFTASNEKIRKMDETILSLTRDLKRQIKSDSLKEETLLRLIKALEKREQIVASVEKDHTGLHDDFEDTVE